ncbi:MAG: hypothetical protein MJZ57_00280 [Bacteroidales bacterium]|nr:hypothetical protein [Bacteroidales bacterium]
MSQKIPIKKFSFRILVFSVIIAGLSLLFQIICPKIASPALPFIVLFFMIITLFTMYIVLHDDKAKAEKRFVSNYLLSRIIKLISCLLFVVLYVILNRKDAWNFAIAFLVIYFLYSIFEVVVLKKENQELSK